VSDETPVGVNWRDDTRRIAFTVGDAGRCAPAVERWLAQDMI
jgi:hypothetical protein